MEKSAKKDLKIAVSKDENMQNDTFEKVELISIHEIFDFENHPFKVREDEEMKNMMESVKEYGVLHPILVRSRLEGGYEIISGHRRKRASEIARVGAIPAIIRDLTDDEATILMVDSNFQREEILPSEKAFAYKMKLEAIKHQGKESLRPMVDKLKSADIIGENTEESGRQVQRYIRLTELIPEILKMVDEKKVAFRPAVEISYLTKDEQRELFDMMQYSDATPLLTQAIKLKKLSQKKLLNTEKIDKIMSENKPNQVLKFKISHSKLDELLPKNMKKDSEIEEFILNCIKEHNQRVKKGNK